MLPIVPTGSFGDQGQGGGGGSGVELLAGSQARLGSPCAHARMHRCTTTSADNVSVQRRRPDLRHATGCGEGVSTEQQSCWKPALATPVVLAWSSAWPDKEDAVSRAPEGPPPQDSPMLGELGDGAGAIPQLSYRRSCRAG